MAAMTSILKIITRKLDLDMHLELIKIELQLHFYLEPRLDSFIILTPFSYKDFK